MNRGENTQRKGFIRQLNELAPRPDPITTEALYRSDRECAETKYTGTLIPLRVVMQSSSEETLQDAYKIIQYRNATLPNELFAATVYLQTGRTPVEVPGLVEEGRLMGFFGPRRPEELSRVATCITMEFGQKQRFYTMDFGRLNPQHALKQTQKYDQEREISTSQVMACLTIDQPELAVEPGEPRCILNGLDSELTDTLFQTSLTRPAVAAYITCSADLSITGIAYHPLRLERNRSLAPMQRQM